MTVEEISSALLAHVAERTKATVTAEQDLFSSGLVNSMFAMELVVHLEQTFGVSITGSDLKLGNFRTVTTMAELVIRLRNESAVTTGA